MMTTICRPLAVIFLFLLLCAPCMAQSKKNYKPDKLLLQTIRQNFTDADAQYKVLMQNLPADSFPKTWYPEQKKYGFSNSGWWCSGFYPGTLLYLYEQSK